MLTFHFELIQTLLSRTGEKGFPFEDLSGLKPFRDTDGRTGAVASGVLQAAGLLLISARRQTEAAAHQGGGLPSR